MIPAYTLVQNQVKVGKQIVLVVQQYPANNIWLTSWVMCLTRSQNHLQPIIYLSLSLKIQRFLFSANHTMKLLKLLLYKTPLADPFSSLPPCMQIVVSRLALPEAAFVWLLRFAVTNFSSLLLPPKVQAQLLQFAAKNIGLNPALLTSPINPQQMTLLYQLQQLQMVSQSPSSCL